MATRNPFAPAKPATRIKALFYGPSESGKTLAALSFPRPAVIDSENGTALHVGGEGVQPFHVYRTKSLADIDDALAMIRADQGKTFDTLVIDSVSVFYDTLLGGVEKLSYRERAAINLEMTKFYNKLTDLDVNLVLIAREAPIYEGAGSSLKAIGVKPDTDANITYIPDFIIRFMSNYSGVTEKSRGYALPDKLEFVDWSVFAPAVNNPAVTCAKEWLEAAVSRTGLDGKALREILGIRQLREFGDWCDPATIARADEAIGAALAQAAGVQ